MHCVTKQFGQNMVSFRFQDIGKRVNQVSSRWKPITFFMNPALFLVLASINKREANLVQCLVSSAIFGRSSCANPSDDDAIANTIYMAVINQLKRIFQVRTNPRDFDRKHHFQTSPCWFMCAFCIQCVCVTHPWLIVA